MGLGSGRKNVEISNQGEVCRVSRAFMLLGFFVEMKVRVNETLEYFNSWQQEQNDGILSAVSEKMNL